MKFSITTSSLYKQLISAFASLDAWLDTIMDERGDFQLFVDMVQHVARSNGDLLHGKGESYNPLTMETHSDTYKVESLRRLLRDQLLACLCMLEDLESNERTPEQNEVLERMYAMCYHLQFHLEELELEGAE